MATTDKNSATAANPAFRHATLFVRPQSAAAAKAKADVISCLRREGVEFCESTQAESKECDLGIAIGGDGSMLHAARTTLALNIPLIGINTGRFGFLADIHTTEISSVLPPILSGQYLVEHRLTGHIAVIRNQQVIIQSEVINEATIQKQEVSRLCELEVHIDGKFLLSQRGDGLIIATPTGSTAYALACNGPIVHPALSLLTLVPISPHQLAYRPFSFGSEHSVEVRSVAKEGAVALTADGTTIHTLDHNDVVTFTAAERKLPVIHPPGYDYFRTLREKLKWGSDLC